MTAIGVPPGTSKSDWAYEVLRERILDGTYGPGARLVVDALGRELGMSPIPLREAVRRLEAEGWVVTRRYAGAEVAPSNPRSVVENMEALALLEGPAMGLLARTGGADLDAAAAINARLRDAVERLSVIDAHRLNREFHFELYRGVPCPPMVAYLRQTWDALDRTRRSTSFYLARAPRAAQEHDRLLEMLHAGDDPDTVERYGRDHKLGTLAALLRDNPDMITERSLLLGGPLVTGATG